MELRGARSVHAPYETLKVKGAWPLCLGDSVELCLEGTLISPDCCLPKSESILVAEVLPPRRSAPRRILLLDFDFRGNSRARSSRGSSRNCAPCRPLRREWTRRIRNPNTQSTPPECRPRGAGVPHISAAAPDALAAFFSASFATT